MLIFFLSMYIILFKKSFVLLLSILCKSVLESSGIYAVIVYYSICMYVYTYSKLAMLLYFQKLNEHYDLYCNNNNMYT